jgi:hypothetical protein
MINDAQVAPSGAVAPLVARDIERVEPVPADRYVVPQEISDAPVVAPQIRLTNYLVHHGEYASRLSRTSVHSNVVGASEPLPEALVEPSAQYRTGSSAGPDAAHGVTVSARLSRPLLLIALAVATDASAQEARAWLDKMNRAVED